MNTALLVGPFSEALNGADISALVGPAAAAVIYGAGTGYQRRQARRSFRGGG